MTRAHVLFMVKGGKIWELGMGRRRRRVNTKIYSPLSHSLKKLTRDMEWGRFLSHHDKARWWCIEQEEKSRKHRRDYRNFFSSFSLDFKDTLSCICAHMQHRTYLLLEVDSGTIYAVEFCLMWVASLDLAREFSARNLTWEFLACSMA